MLFDLNSRLASKEEICAIDAFYYDNNYGKDSSKVLINGKKFLNLVYLVGLIIFAKNKLLEFDVLILLYQTIKG